MHHITQQDAVVFFYKSSKRTWPRMGKRILVLFVGILVHSWPKGLRLAQFVVEVFQRLLTTLAFQIFLQAA
jgi:hypothetical protein